jgi:hypothetical protein
MAIVEDRLWREVAKSHVSDSTPGAQVCELVQSDLGRKPTGDSYSHLATEPMHLATDVWKTHKKRAGVKVKKKVPSSRSAI